jgi:hypothetical protein
MAATRVPTFVNFDVEPVGFQRDHASWTGFREWVELLDGLRDDLAARSGRAPRFGWYFRMDPQIDALHGDAAYAARHFSDLVDHLRDQGDVFGLHVHPLRWSAERDLWIHDFADADWVTECIERAHATYLDCFGAPPVRFRSGAGFLDPTVVAAIDRLGIEVDLTLEPGYQWHADVMRTEVDDSPCVGAPVDTNGAPREVYRPAGHDFRIADARTGRRVVMVPISTSARLPEKPAWWRAARALRRPRTRRARVLRPASQWPSPAFLWDLLAAETSAMRRPYISLPIRSDPLAGPGAARAAAVLRALPQHPLAGRIDCSDPAQEAAGLLAPVARGAWSRAG